MQTTIAPRATIEEDRGYLKLKIWACRTMYANVNSPREKNGVLKGFDCTFLLPKTAEGAEGSIKTIREYGAKKFGPRGWKCPLIKDGDKVYAEELETAGGDVSKVSGTTLLKQGHWVIEANSSLARPPVAKGVIYSGCYAGAVIGVAPYDFTDQQSQEKVKGVKGYLNGVQFHGDGERLGGGAVNVEDELGVETPKQEVAAMSSAPTGGEGNFDDGAITGSNPPARSGADDDDNLPF
jgi:hypothetical protein